MTVTAGLNGTYAIRLYSIAHIDYETVNDRFADIIALTQLHAIPCIKIVPAVVDNPTEVVLVVEKKDLPLKLLLKIMTANWIRKWVIVDNVWQPGCRCRVIYKSTQPIPLIPDDLTGLDQCPSGIVESVTFLICVSGSLSVFAAATALQNLCRHQLGIPVDNWTTYRAGSHSLSFRLTRDRYNYVCQFWSVVLKCCPSVESYVVTLNCVGESDRRFDFVLDRHPPHDNNQVRTQQVSESPLVGRVRPLQLVDQVQVQPRSTGAAEITWLDHAFDESFSDSDISFYTTFNEDGEGEPVAPAESTGSTLPLSGLRRSDRLRNHQSA